MKKEPTSGPVPLVTSLNQSSQSQNITAMSALATYPAMIFVLLCLLAVAVWTDLMSHRIPNTLTLAMLVSGLGMQAWAAGATGVLAALGGAAIGFGIFLPFYLLHGMGAGDVKLMAGVGAYLGMHGVLLAAGLSLGIGSVIGLVLLLVHRGLKPATQRYGSTLRHLAVTGKWSYVPPASGEAAAKRFPYAIAIGLGTAAALWWLAIF
jgi:prepilin peptidase CpaA